jgi:hypothetical protein
MEASERSPLIGVLAKRGTASRIVGPVQRFTEDRCDAISQILFREESVS